MKTHKKRSSKKTTAVGYIPTVELNQPLPVVRKRGCLASLLSTFIWTFIIIVLIFFALTFGRQWYDSLLTQSDQNKTVHPDESMIKTGIHSQVRPQVTLVYKDKEGKKVRVIADAEAYSQFVNQQAAHLEKARTQLLTQTEARLHKALSIVFDGMRRRIDRFADWYFAYTTTYKILWEATTSATRHVLSTEATTVSEGVSYDVEKYLHARYENIILRPEITDPQLQATYRAVLKTTHGDYVNVLSQMQTDFQAFVSKYTTHLEMPNAENTVLVLDWESQFNKINMAEYEKGPKGAALGAVLAVGGAAMGKAVAGAAAEGVASKAVASAAGKGMLAKFASPFVSKAVLASAGGAVGALGGPIGIAIGVIGGIGIDFAINQGVELTQRDTFITDVREALDMTQAEWDKQMLQSLREAVNIWMDDTIQLLPRYEA